MSRFLIAVLTAGLVTGLAVSTAAPAVAAPVVAAAISPTSATIKGDVTGDGLPDQVTLGSDSAVAVPSCSARVRPGLAGGATTPGGAFRPLPVRGTRLYACPDLGVVVDGPTPARARLAVTWSSVGPIGGRSVQFFRWVTATRSWAYDGGTTGQYQPSTFGSRDVDGDGFGDLYESTDQGTGVVVFVGRASTYTQLWTSSPSSADTLSFADFDHRAGTDVLDGHSFFGASNVGVTVVDGRTGTVVTLVADDSPYASTYTPQAVDINHDGWVDVRVRVVGWDGSPRPNLVFRNRANGTVAFTRL